VSRFGERFARAFATQMLPTLGEQSSTYTTAAGVSSTVTVIFNEFVGFIDNKQRAIITVAAADVPAPTRGDSFVIAGETQRWDVIDVRNAKAGEFEIRVDATLEES
jgi:hypothetical protein